VCLTLKFELGIAWEDMGAMEDLGFGTEPCFSSLCCTRLASESARPSELLRLLLHVSFVPSANFQTLVSYPLISLLAISAIVMIISFLNL
jgi:hypothetical protein